MTRTVAFSVHHARTLRRMTLDRMASLIHVSPTTIVAWEKGRSLPNAAALARMCSLLRVSADWMLDLTDNMNPRFRHEP